MARKQKPKHTHKKVENWGWKDCIAGNVLVLLEANPGTTYGTMNGPLSLAKVIPEHHQE